MNEEQKFNLIMIGAVCKHLADECTNEDIAAILKELSDKLKVKKLSSLNNPKRKLLDYRIDNGRNSEHAFAKDLVNNALKMLINEECFQRTSIEISKEFLRENCLSCYLHVSLSIESYNYERGKIENEPSAICKNPANCNFNIVRRSIVCAQKMRRISIFLEEYADIYLYAECSEEMFNTILSLYSSNRNKKVYSSYVNIIVSRIKSDIYCNHYKVINFINENYLLWKQVSKKVLK